ncbi:hypothetical protein THAOC_04290 [Thalassiosira oceanica]|uniref:DUF393 domain-containing protein n=1 Tax=Thalassiosira oceanica TaxID=159749 RepID=K0TAC7_THAOC|nr:hypothetical protein THAOC_04290 [Thalassiosira oceanica]|eukprot:EJK74059.1 hypothetical protein THAOC_04290 [Thalassiosira oceanica]
MNALLIAAILLGCLHESAGFRLPLTTASSSSSPCGSHRRPRNPKRTCLGYASKAAVTDGGPMSKVDSSKSGGCPFIDTKFEQRSYAAPAIFSEDDSRPIILFDGECNMCNKFVQILLHFSSDNAPGNMRFAALQSRVGRLLLNRMPPDLRSQVLRDNIGEGEENEGMERYKTIVICGPDTTYINSGAALRIIGGLDGPSKRLKVAKLLVMAAYVVPVRLRDRVYHFVSKRRKRWFGSADECMLWDDRFESRFVDDGVLTGVYRDPWADPKAPVVVEDVNLFEDEDAPTRGDKVRVLWTDDSDAPSVSYDDEFPDGICLAGATGTVGTIDLPMRVVLRVDRSSLGLGPSESGEETMLAWVRPREVAKIEESSE